MKFKSLLLSLLAVISLSAIAEDVNWEPMPGYNIPGTKAYIDNGATQRVEIQDREYILIAILISSDKEFQVTGGKFPLMARSTVKKIIVECRSASIMPAGDYYFDVEKPTYESEPVGATAQSPRQVMVIPRSHFVYLTVCAKSV